MPPRRGLIGRLTTGIRRIVRGGGEPSPPPPPPRPPPQPPQRPPRPPPAPPREPEPPPRRDEQFRDSWNDNASDRIVTEIHDRTGDSESEIYQNLFDTFYPLVTEESRATQLEMWRDFIDAFVNDDQTFTKNDFFAEWDIARSSFSWEAWRQARGYGRRK